MTTLLDQYNAITELSQQLAPIIEKLDFSTIQDLNTESILTTGIGLATVLFYGIKFILSYRKTKKEQAAAKTKTTEKPLTEIHVYVNVTQINNYNTYSFDVNKKPVNPQQPQKTRPRKVIV